MQPAFLYFLQETDSSTDRLFSIIVIFIVWRLLSLLLEEQSSKRQQEVDYLASPIDAYPESLSRLHQRASDLARWLLAGELPRVSKELPLFFVRLRLKQIFDSLGQRLKLGGTVCLQLRRSSEDVLLGSLAAHPCWAFLWHRVIMRRLLYWTSEARASTKFHFDVLLESRQDLQREFSPFSGYLALALAELLQLVKEVEKGRPGRVERVLRRHWASDFLVLAERRVRQGAGEEVVFRWEQLSVGDFFVAAICHEAAETLRQRVLTKLAAWRQLRWWEWCIPFRVVYRRRIADRVTSWFASAISPRIARMHVIRPVLDPEARWDDTELTFILILLAERSSRAWRAWLEYCICRRIVTRGGEPAVIRTLSAVFARGSSGCRELVLRVASRSLSDLIVTPLKLGDAKWANIESVLGLCAELVLCIARQREEGARNGNGVCLGPEVLLFLKNLDRALISLLQAGGEGLIEVGKFLQKVFEEARQHELEFSSLEEFSQPLRLRRFLERWMFVAVSHDLPKLRGMWQRFGGAEVEVDSYLRALIKQYAHQWLETVGEPTSVDCATAEGDELIRRLRGISNNIAASDPEVAGIMRLVIVRSLCRAKHSQLTGGIR